MTKVQAVPTGYGTVTPFLNVKGAAEAIEFYKRAFGAEERSRMPGPNNMLMHAEIKIGNSLIMLADAMMNAPTQASLHIYVDDADAMWTRAVNAGCKVEMPIADMFWGDRYGVLSDRFGNRWSIATHKEDVPPDQMKSRMEAAMKNMPKP
jgi:uncharacterized glyoxalase superfamily protein PhnB